MIVPDRDKTGPLIRLFLFRSTIRASIDGS